MHLNIFPNTIFDFSTNHEQIDNVMENTNIPNYAALVEATQNH